MKRPLLTGAAIVMLAVAPPAAIAQSAPQTPPGDGVVATVNGEPITYDDIRTFHASLPPQYQQIPLETIVSQLIERLIDQKLAAAAARASGLADEPSVKKRLALMQDGFLNQLYVNQRLKEVVTEARLREAYEKSIALEPKREEVHARHILLETEAQALAVVVELKAGADFAELAKEKSTGPSARSGGDLGFFGEGQMVPAFSAAAFALEAGQITEKPVKTQFGWHVIKVEERRVAGQRSFEQVRPQLQQKMTEDAYDALMAELRAKAKVELNTPGGGIQPVQ